MKTKMTTPEAVQALQALDASDPEVAHVRADEILLAVLRNSGRSAVAEAYEELVARAPWWGAA